MVNVSSDVYDQNLTNNRDNVTVFVSPAADLAITKTANQTLVDYLDTVKFVLTVTNNGPDAGVNVRVTDLLPAGLEFVSSSASRGSYDNSTGEWTVGDLAADETATLDIVARAVISNISIDNVVNVSSDVYNPNPNKNATATITVKPASNLKIKKTADRRAVRLGQNVKFIITVINSGPDTALNTTVRDILPDSMRYISSRATAGSYNHAAGTWVIGDLPAGQKAILEIIVQMVRRGAFINTATVSSSSQVETNDTSYVKIDVTDKAGPGPSPVPHHKIPMKPTGIPIFALVMGVITVAAGSLISRRG